MPSPVGPLPEVAADSGFAAGPTVAGAATTMCLPLQDLALAEAIEEGPEGQRTSPKVRPMTPEKAQRCHRSGILCCFGAGQS